MDRNGASEVKNRRKDMVDLIVKKFTPYLEEGYAPTSYATMHFHHLDPYMCVIISYHGHFGKAVGTGFNNPDNEWDVAKAYAEALQRAAEDTVGRLA